MAAAARHEALATVPSVHLAAMRAHDRKAVLVQREGGRWQETPDWRLDRQVIRLGLYLRERAGLLPGHRVVIVSPPRRESLLADLAVMVQGAVAVAVDPELPAPALAAALAKIAPHAAFVAGPPELERVAEACPVLCGGTRPHPAGRADVATGSVGAASSGRLVSFDAPAQGAALLSEVLDLGGTLDTAERAVAFRARAREVTAGQLALEYVDRSPDGSARSGAFTHGEVVAQLRAVWSEEPARKGDLAYLAGHATTPGLRLALLAFVGDGVTTVAFGNPGHEPEEIAELRPHKIVAPRGFLVAGSGRSGAPRKDGEAGLRSWIERALRRSSPRRRMGWRAGGQERGARWIRSIDSLDEMLQYPGP